MTGSQDISSSQLPCSISPASTSSNASSGGYSCPSRQPGSYPLPVQGYVTSDQPQTEMASNGGLCTYPAPVISSPDKLGHEANGHQHTMTSGPPGFMGGHWPEGEAMPPHYPAYPGYEAAPPTPFVINGGQCEAGGGHGVTVTTVPGDGQQPSAASSRGQHTVHFHVHQGEAVSLQLGSEVQMVHPNLLRSPCGASREPPWSECPDRYFIFPFPNLILIPIPNPCPRALCSRYADS